MADHTPSGSTPCRRSIARARWESITWPGKPTAYPCAHDHAHCDFIGCVEHVDGMHVDHCGDAIVHVGCDMCRPPADHTPSPATDGLLSEHDRNDLLLGHHDGLCPEGPDCRSRWLHAQSPTIYSSLTPALLATFEGILADRIARALLAAHPAPPSETATEPCGTCEWAGYPIGGCPHPAPPSETATEERLRRTVRALADVTRDDRMRAALHAALATPPVSSDEDRADAGVRLSEEALHDAMKSALRWDDVAEKPIRRAPGDWTTAASAAAAAAYALVAARLAEVEQERDALLRGIRCPQCCATEWNEASRLRSDLAREKARADALAEQVAVALREHRVEWADYIANWSGAVGPQPPTVESIIAALRMPEPPFGRARGLDGAP